MAVLLTVVCGFVQAQNVSPNLIGPNNLTGTVATTSLGGGYSGGSTPGYNSSTNTIMFGYTQATVAYTYAFSQALQNSGMTITGYNYSWDYINQNPYNGIPANGNLSAIVNFASTSNTSLYSRSWVLGPTTDWTNVSGTETFANNGLLASNIANFSLKFSGKDSRFWAGYYGPQVKNPSLSLNYTFDACSSDPLSSPSCPGYAAAYLTQQCTANPLYNPSCPGYAVAYQTQQCNINPLFSPDCPGYASAYLTYQCNANPLYSTTCPGYEQAYFDQQCSINPLYNTRCPGYAVAYFDQQCRLNALYDQRCPNYATAYAKKTLLEQQNLASTVATAGVVAQTAQANTTSTSTSDGSSSVAVAVVADPIVNQAVTSTATSTSPAAAATATVSLSPTPPPPPAPAPQEKKPEGGQQGGGGPQPQGNGPQGGEKPQPSARQEMMAKRADAAKKEAVEKGKNLANEMGKAADMESQKQVQNVVIQAMGFTPGFDAYNKVMVPDAYGYKPFTVYNNQKNVDNKRLGWGLYGPSDRLHNDLVNSQYGE
jgi:hypothetical protein